MTEAVGRGESFIAAGERELEGPLVLENKSR
jgi:hypothetical protein